MYLYKKVLVVEKDLNLRYEISTLLSEFNYDILFASHATDAFESILNEKPSLIICNTNLGYFSGFDLLEEIKEKQKNFILPPFIFISKEPSYLNIRKAIKLGAVDLVALPFEDNDLEKTIESTLLNFNFLKDNIVKIERKWLSEELHDNIQQIILASLMHLRFLESDVDKLDELSRESFFMTLGFLEKAIEETRSLSHQMHKVITPTNFLEKLSSITSSLEKNNFIIDVILPTTLEFSCSNDELFHLMRVLQELINNIIKHSKAKKVVLKISSSSDFLNIYLKDDGVGFENVEYDNFGLTVVKRRLNKINADFSIESIKNEGVEVQISLSNKVIA